MARRARDALYSDVVFQGTITISSSLSCTVSLRNKGKLINTKFFSISEYENPKEVAEEYRREQSTLQGLTLRKTQVPRRAMEYIAGVIDGDGCFPASRRGFNVGIYQSQDTGTPDMLLFVQKWYGGSIKSARRDALAKRRTEHNLRIHGPRCVWLIRDYIANGILKKNQAENCLRMLSVKKLARTEMIGKITSAKRMEEYQKLKFDIGDQRFTWAYIAGLFDAEGCVRYEDTPRMTIAQLSNKSILECIKNKIGGKGTLTDGMLRLYGDDAIKLIRSILPYSIGKACQMKFVLLIHALHSTKAISPKVANEIATYLSEMKRL